jgi:hypothetical protein
MESNPHASNMRVEGKFEKKSKKGKPGRILSLSLAGDDHLQLRFPAKFCFLRKQVLLFLRKVEFSAIQTLLISFIKKKNFVDFSFQKIFFFC